ncbi:hypothetical protein [Asticcacaulis sp. EMRT-3]|uniref:hypothetical protein n=1 Tax=Asticcacaulis sp. EMRT-3 TaxID=3040349 RepID=UPI0024AF407F|nr:hypothetical protein [Asticcacaulis sp. EMRT-3]MDI7774090.1 hypothetical protein [Asticcacaulis sp. EMRT-3]
MAATTSSGKNALIVVLAVIIIAILAVGAVYLMQDHRGPAERVGDAVSTLPKGVDKAANKLGDQSPAQNVKNNLDNAADDVTDHGK